MTYHSAIGLLLLATLTGCPAPSTSVPSETPLAQTSSRATPKANAPASQVDDAFLIVAGRSFGSITAETTESSLSASFGPNHLRSESIYVGDGQEMPGMSVFPEDPQQRVEVVWFEKPNIGVQLIQIHGDASKWKTAEGVTLGTSLTELERINGKPFELTGLGWDFGGTVTNWDGGKLENLTLRVDTTGEVKLSEDEMAQISGDQTVRSDNPAIRKANPTVFKITIGFPLPKPTTES